MKALVYTGTQQLVYRDEPEPTTSANEVLVEVEASGICGSDMHAWHGHDARRIPPMILGHELAGRVIDTVAGGPDIGQRVAINPLISCGQCRDCRAGNSNLCATRDLVGLGRAGGYAERVSIPVVNLLPLEQSLDVVKASLMEPTAVSLHAIALAERMALRPISESRCLVIGGGAIGLLAALILHAKGVRELAISETSSARRKTLSKLDCGDVQDPLGKHNLTDNHFELVIDAVGSGATRAAASRLTRSGGTISHIGLQDNESGLDTRRLTLQEISFIGNYTYSGTDMTAALDIITRGALGSLDWVETRSLSAGAAAFEDIHYARAAAPKIVLIPDPP